MMKYEERLRHLQLPTLKYRRMRGDMIEAYKIFKGIYDCETTGWLTEKHRERPYDMRNHKFSIYQSQIRYDLRKFCFSNRIISLWNSLPDRVVSADTVNSFKSRLDRLWKYEDIYYNYKANVLNTGSRSNVDIVFA